MNEAITTVAHAEAFASAASAARPRLWSSSKATAAIDGTLGTTSLAASRAWAEIQQIIADQPEEPAAPNTEPAPLPPKEVIQ